jgi:RNA polymerase sigma-70 factor (ECF subfamily)
LPALSALPAAPAYRLFSGFTRRVLARHGVGAADLDDLVQEVFVTLHRKGFAFADERAARSWIFGTARRIASNHRRSNERALTRAPQWSMSAPPSPEQALAHAEDLAAIDRFTDGLSAPARDVFRLSELEERTAPEIASTLGLGLHTTYSHIRRTRQRFARAMMVVMALVLLMIAMAAGSCSTERADDRVAVHFDAVDHDRAAARRSPHDHAVRSAGRDRRAGRPALL